MKIFYFTFFWVICTSFFCPIEGIGNEQLKSVVERWNTKIKDQSVTMVYSEDEDTKNKNIENVARFTLYRNGLIGTECGTTFDKDIRQRSEFKDQYPGTFVVSHGPVNNRVKEKSWLHWLKSFELLKPMIRTWSALPYAFNYEEEAKLMIQVLQHFHTNKVPIECIQTICYGFQGIICGIHALKSDDSRAQKVRKELNISYEEAEILTQSIRLIIAQAPMIRLSDTVRCALSHAITTAQLGLILLGIFLQYRNSLHKDKIALYGAFILGIGFLKMPQVLARLSVQLTPFIIRFIMPRISPAVASYGGDITVLLQDLQNANFKNICKDLTLLVTHQTCDEFVGPLSEEDKALLKEVFGEKTVLVASSEKDHLHESDEQKAVQHVVRARTKMAYDTALYESLELYSS